MDGGVWWVCRWAPRGQETSIDADAANAGSVVFTTVRYVRLNTDLL